MFVCLVWSSEKGAFWFKFSFEWLEENNGLIIKHGQCCLYGREIYKNDYRKELCAIKNEKCYEISILKAQGIL